MDELDVRVSALEPMCVANFHAFGPSPELDAAAKLVDWAKPKGYLDDHEYHRIFGFNNPNPSAGSPNYGYEFWIQIDSETEVGEDVGVKEFEGGLYAITRCHGIETITATWMKLAEWVENNSKYRFGTQEMLEEHVGPFPFEVTEDFTLDLYCSIQE
jgi:DNA gyrase inhibitor GyrI